MSLPSWTFHPPPIPSHPSRLSQNTWFRLPATYNKFPLAIFPWSLNLPHSSRCVHTSVLSAYPLLPCKQFHEHHLSNYHHASHSVTSDFLWPHESYSLPGSSVHGIFQARMLEWVAIPFSRESSHPRDWTQVSHIAGGFLTVQATREAPYIYICIYIYIYIYINIWYFSCSDLLHSV